MTQIALSKILAMLDAERGLIIKQRKKCLATAKEAGGNLFNDEVQQVLDKHEAYGEQLRLLNKLKKEFSLVPDTDEPTLGL